MNKFEDPVDDNLEVDTCAVYHSLLPVLASLVHTGEVVLTLRLWSTSQALFRQSQWADIADVNRIAILSPPQVNHQLFFLLLRIILEMVFTP